MEKFDLNAAHEATEYNRNTLAHGGKCGCFHCLKVFLPSDMMKWCSEEDEGEEVTAICPYCGVDSVIGESVGFPITQDLLTAMYQRWFGEEDSNEGSESVQRLPYWRCCR